MRIMKLLHVFLLKGRVADLEIVQTNHVDQVLTANGSLLSNGTGCPIFVTHPLLKLTDY